MDDNGKVSKILNRNAAVGTSTNAVEEETFQCVLPTGTYDIYAFANITRDELRDATGLTFTENGDAPDNIIDSVWQGLQNTDGREEAESVTQLGVAYEAKVTNVSNNNLNLWNSSETDGKPIPMTGFLSRVRIENTIEEKFSIEVVRMVAKVELQFFNPSDRNVTINEVAFSPVTTSKVSLFPTYDVLGEKAFRPLDGAEYARLSHGVEINVGKATVNNGVSNLGTNTHTFFIKESLSAAAGSFTVWLAVTYENGVTEFLQCSPTVDIKDYINRNDWIRIPITLSDYDVKVEALFYPPIGGYPAIVEGIDPDGAQQFTFGTQGKFAIMPYVTDKTKGTPVAYQNYRIEVDEIKYSGKSETGNWKSPDWQTASIIYSSDQSITVAEDKGIFTELPVTVEESSTALPYEILGQLNTNQGIARVKLKINIYEGEYSTGAQPKSTYTRFVYIIRDNAGGNN